MHVCVLVCFYTMLVCTKQMRYQLIKNRYILPFYTKINQYY